MENKLAPREVLEKLSELLLKGNANALATDLTAVGAALIQQLSADDILNLIEPAQHHKGDHSALVRRAQHSCKRVCLQCLSLALAPTPIRQ